MAQNSNDEKGAPFLTLRDLRPVCNWPVFGHSHSRTSELPFSFLVLCPKCTVKIDNYWDAAIGLVEKGFNQFNSALFNKNNRCAIHYDRFCDVKGGDEKKYSFRKLWGAGDTLLVTVNMEERSFTVRSKKDPLKLMVKILNIPNNRFMVFGGVTYYRSTQWTIMEQSIE